MKIQIIPPVQARQKKTFHSYITLDNQRLVTAWRVIDEVVGNHRKYRYSISVATKNDLLRFAALECCEVFVGTFAGRPYLAFPRALADKWLAQGGSLWIVSELEARAAKRVIAFPGRRS